MRCNEQNTIPDVVLERIEFSQAGTGRHKCVACAYTEGIAARRRGTALALISNLEECNHHRRAPVTALAGLAQSQAGGGRHKCTICAFQLGFEDEGEQLARAEANVATEAATHGTDQAIGEVEGREVYRLGRVYERSPQNRAIAVREHGTTCAACGFNFDEFYGAAHARSYIEIHHLNPLAQRGEHLVDPIADLRPLCANCHSMVHRNPGQILSIEDLRVLIRQARENRDNPPA